ncbi:nucleotidyl transferase AbiEii/AbiGii toxin family protein [Streptomyces olivaceus]
MPELHARLLEDVLALGSPYPLVLTGGYAVQAHQLVDRPSQDLDVATQNPAPMADIAHYLVERLTRLGWRAETIEVSPLSARFLVTDPDSGQECEVDILKEVFWHPTVPTSYGPVLSEQDVIGTKVRAIAERGAARDLIDVYAASHRWTTADLEEFGRRHARPDTLFGPAELQARLVGADWIDDTEFAAYGLDEQTIADLRTWARAWSDAMARRAAAENAYEKEYGEAGSVQEDPYDSFDPDEYES